MRFMVYNLYVVWPLSGGGGGGGGGCVRIAELARVIQ